MHSHLAQAEHACGVNRDAILKAAYFATIAVGEEPTRRAVAEMAKRICGRGFRHDEVLRVVSSLQTGTKWEPTRDPMGTTNRAQNGQLGTKPEPSRDPTCAPHKVLESGLSLFPNGNSTLEKATPKKRSRTAADRSWVEPLRAEVNALASKTLVSLTLAERVALARYHALEWANCTVDEAKNRAMAAKIAVGIASMAGDRKLYDLTVADYLAFGKRMWVANGRTPMRSAWAVTGAIGYAVPA